jgi:hypothetical protein
VAGSLPEVGRLHLRGLEGQAQSKLKLAHSIRRTWGGVRFNIRDLAVAGAIDTCTTATLVLVEAEDGVVEYVIGVHTELELYPLRECEVFGNGCIGTEESRPTETVVAVVPDIIESRVRKSVAAWQTSDPAADRVRDWVKESYRVRSTVETARSKVERPRALIRPAHPGVLLQITNRARQAGRPGQATRPSYSPANLPATDNLIHTAANTTSERLTFAEGQLVNQIRNPLVIPQVVVRPVSD